MSYASVSDVATYAGVNVDAAAIARAQAVIELYSNRTQAASGAVGVTDRDLHWLRLAVCYQAAYMDAHPETFNLMEVSSMSQGDLSVSFKADAAIAILAPLARMALGRTTWSRSRSIKVNTDFVTEQDDEVFDTSEEWEWHPLGYRY